MPSSPQPRKSPPLILCIAGFDPSGGGGLLADARACAAQGAFALCVQTALVPQNTCGVKQIEPVAAQMVVAQVEALLEDFEISGVKVGLMPNADVVEALIPHLRKLREKNTPIVIDTVFAPTTGPGFSDTSTIEAIKNKLLPLATMVTPNAGEAQILSGVQVQDVPTMEQAALQIYAQTGAATVLVKGGHILPGVGAEPRMTDVFYDGQRFFRLSGPVESGGEVRGTGCMLASAITAHMAQGATPLEAAQRARSWLTGQIREAHALGKGRRIAVG